MTVLHDDPYRVLGVARDADQAAIRRAYRALAKTYHPDMNPGDAKAEDMFKKVSLAYDILGDEDKRARFDRGEIGPDGAERAGAHGAHGSQATGEGPFTFRWRTTGQGPEGGLGGADFSDIFADLFGQRGPGMGPGAARRHPARGAAARLRLTISFEEAALGARKTVRLGDGTTLAVTIPPGIDDGHTLRLKGKGGAAPPGGTPGDALVEVSVARHPRFRRDGLDVHVDVPVSLAEAVLGGKVTVPTPAGPVAMTLPANTSSGKTLRLKGRGIHKGAHKGDLYARAMIVLPDTPDPDLTAFVRDWSKRSDIPRAS